MEPLPLPPLTAVAAVAAALVHVLIFVLESVRWRLERTWRVFGIASQEDAETTQPLAFNQGFYNLFLAVGALAGVVLMLLGGVTAAAIGLGFIVLSTGSMLAAALVLILGNRKLARPAAIQGLPPLIALLGLLVLV
ncbi:MULTISPECIES: DUF1304 domain-containing protein [unclassified Arthrobacter]|uniref:DUF1304 domain-containing protein n=1 Tax=Arthrobacter sp. N1 TaxID=619291 RepID=UPI003BAF9E94